MSISIALTILAILIFTPADSVVDLDIVHSLNDKNLSTISILEESSSLHDTKKNDWVYFADVLSDDEITTLQHENATENCTERSINEFPEIFTFEQRRQGAVILHIFFGFYCFILTAFVCNDYLLPALDIICTRLNISTDVAGATFLATASCFPELFVNVVGTFLTESDLGVGTVMGGAVFNTFATPACGALSAIHAIPLEWKILTRDTIIYAISVSVLVIIMWDGVIMLYEAIILMALFLGYLIILFCSNCFVRWYNKLAHLYTGKTDTITTTFSKNENSSQTSHQLHRKIDGHRKFAVT